MKVCEVFLSIQGEGTRAGLPCVLVRLAECNLRCLWCDSQYAWTNGQDRTVDQIVDQVREFHCPLVELTGGEPLIQPNTPVLLTRLCEEGFEVLLETNGSLDIAAADSRVVRIVDFKCPSSGQSEHNRWENVDQLRRQDEVKFVVANRDDFIFARQAVMEYKLTDRCAVLFAPVQGRVEPAELASWMLGDPLLPRRARLNLQLHKLIWPGLERGA